MNIQKFVEEIQTPIGKLTVTQLREREETWRALWSWTDDTVKRFLLRAGTEVRVIQRNYQGKVGELGQVTFVPKDIEVTVYEKAYNYNDGKYYFENKVIQYPWASLAWVEGIIDSTQAEEIEAPSVEPVEADSFA